MIKYYKYKDKYIFSLYQYSGLKKIDEKEIKRNAEKLYFLNKLNPLKSRRSFLVTHPSLLFIKEEGTNLLLLKDAETFTPKIPNWIQDKINDSTVISINTNYPNWQEALKIDNKKKWKINLLALGDVGSTLLIGLRLLGGDCIEEIGIYDRNLNRLQRWDHELNQIRRPFDERSFPPINPIDKEDIFDCDMFVFCASKGIPSVGSGVEDVRMAQFHSNSEIIKEYAQNAREENFKGVFAVVSDPVDLLCKVAFLESNKDEKGNYDLKGLAANQVIGYGLGVMNGRACFYAEESEETINYIDEGRVFGPHGQGLIVANSIENYNKEVSDYLTNKTLTANLEVRKFGFKPYVAPSLSSGALSIISTIEGNWFYGSTYMGQAYLGSKCKLIDGQIELEQLKLPEELFHNINQTYQKLVDII